VKKFGLMLGLLATVLFVTGKRRPWICTTERRKRKWVGKVAVWESRKLEFT